MLPSEVLVTPTVAGVPALVFGGCAAAVEEEPPLLPQAAIASPASATIAPLARKVRADLRGIMIRSFGRGIIERTFPHDFTMPAFGAVRAFEPGVAIGIHGQLSKDR
jgi:hypothetical protein